MKDPTSHDILTRHGFSTEQAHGILTALRPPKATATARFRATVSTAIGLGLLALLILAIANLAITHSLSVTVAETRAEGFGRSATTHADMLILERMNDHQDSYRDLYARIYDLARTIPPRETPHVDPSPGHVRRIVQLSPPELLVQTRDRPTDTPIPPAISPTHGPPACPATPPVMPPPPQRH